MPRPKVHPSMRQRASEACNSCREAKKRCSGTAPCTHCLRRGTGDTCFISHRPRGHRSHRQSLPNPDTTTNNVAMSNGLPTFEGIRPITSAERSSLQALQSLQSLQSPVTSALLGPQQPATPVNPTSATRSNEFRPISPSDSRTTEIDASTTRSQGGRPSVSSNPRPAQEWEPEPEPSLLSAKPSSRMLLNLRGERVYIGGGGSLSFLQLVRGIVSDKIGPSQFSRGGNSDTMLEKESPQSHSQTPNFSVMSPEAKLMCAESYHGVVGGFVDMFLPNELETLLSTSRLTKSKRALTDLVLAIGLQCDPSSDTHDRELSYFRESQSHVFAGMLEDPDIDMVRIFLIMSFYLLGECRRNTAFLYLGIATRAAVALGLHSRETYTDMNDPVHQLRLRVWMSLRVLDIVVNSLLGRPAATAGIHCDMQQLIDEVLTTSTDRGLACLGASYRIVAIINTIVDLMYDKKEITIAAIENHLQELEQWSQSLPDFLRTAPSADDMTTSPEKGAIGRVHVSCLYYFAVTLVTRPILVSSLTQQPANGLVHSQLATACLDAAMFIVQTCAGAQKHGILQANMCILKAIIFPAGLVLGFQIFAKSNVDYGVESAFHEARELLRFLGTKSPQAALYHDILTSLSNSITEYRQRAVTKGRSSYVSKIFNFDGASSSGNQNTTTQEAEAEPLGADEQRTQMDDLLATLSFGQNTPIGTGDMLFDWDSLDISQWDSFPYTAGL